MCHREGELLGVGHLASWAGRDHRALPSQQTSEPSYPDIVLIAINRHGVLLIHPKTKVGEPQAGLGGWPGSRERCMGKAAVTCSGVYLPSSGGALGSSSDSAARLTWVSDSPFPCLLTLARTCPPHTLLPLSTHSHTHPRPLSSSAHSPQKLLTTYPSAPQHTHSHTHLHAHPLPHPCLLTHP